MKTIAQTCTCCGQTIRQPKVKAAMPAAQMSDVELFSYLKRIGVREDTRFFLEHAGRLSPELRTEGNTLLLELECRASKPADAKRLNSLKDRARTAQGWPRIECGTPGHHHTIALNAERCRDEHAMLAEHAELLAVAS